MITCRECKQISKSLTVEVCQYCGARSWDGPPTELTMKQKLILVKSKAEVILFGTGYLAVAFGMLWMFVFAIKWMWRHS